VSISQGAVPDTWRPGDEKVYRGSRRRLRRLKWRDNITPEFWIFVVLALFLLFVVLPWMIQHP
jgi:hypothetical protein